MAFQIILPSNFNWHFQPFFHVIVIGISSHLLCNCKWHFQPFFTVNVSPSWHLLYSVYWLLFMITRNFNKHQRLILCSYGFPLSKKIPQGENSLFVIWHFLVHTVVRASAKMYNECAVSNVKLCRLVHETICIVKLTGFNLPLFLVCLLLSFSYVKTIGMLLYKKAVMCIYNMKIKI